MSDGFATGVFAMSNRTRLLGILFALALELLIPLSAHAQWIEGDSISVCATASRNASDQRRAGLMFAWQSNELSVSASDGF